MFFLTCLQNFIWIDKYLVCILMHFIGTGHILVKSLWKLLISVLCVCSVVVCVVCGGANLAAINIYLPITNRVDIMKYWNRVKTRNVYLLIRVDIMRFWNRVKTINIYLLVEWTLWNFETE